MNSRQNGQLTTLTNNTRTAVSQLNNGHGQMVRGANNLANNRIVAANANARNATNQFGQAHKNLNNTANKLQQLANQAPNKLNKNLRIASNYFKKAAIEAAKAATAKSLVLIGKGAEALGKVANTQMSA